MFSSNLLGPYVLTNVISLFLVIAAILSPKVTRWGFVLIFFGAAIANGIIAINNPESYLEFGRSALAGAYSDFIGGFFREHILPIVLAIAVAQLCIAFLLTRKDPLLKLGVIGASVFLAAILPLGMGSAVPAPLLMIVALAVMYRRQKLDAIAAPQT